MPSDESDSAFLLKRKNLQPTDSINPVPDDVNVELSPENGEEAEDFDHELQQLGDEKALTSSPPPTLDDSISDHGSPLVPIAATVTLKVLESPRSVVFTTTSRPTSGSGEAGHPLSPTSENVGDVLGDQMEEESMVTNNDTEHDTVVEISPEESQVK